MELPKELIEAARNNNLVIFVGAGLSCKLKNRKGQELGDWDNLVKQIVYSFPEEQYPYAASLKAAIEYGGLNAIQVLDKIEIYNWLPKDKIVDFVKDFFSLSNNNDWSLPENLCRLSDTIITTNYDNAFEHVNMRFKVQLPSFVPYQAFMSQKYDIPSSHFTQDEKSDDDKAQEITLFKLHGSIDDSNTLVIFPYDYASLYDHRAHLIISDLKKLIINKTILLIGCGMGDWQINNIFLTIKKSLGPLNQKHFIMTMETEFKRKESVLRELLTPVFITEYRRNKNSSPEERNIDNIIAFLLKEKSRGITVQATDNFDSKLDELSDSDIFSQNEETLKISCEKYRKAALSLNSRNENVFYKWGLVLLRLAKLQQEQKFYEESIEKLRIALQLNPNKEEIAVNLRHAQDAMSQLDINDIIRKHKNSNH